MDEQLDATAHAIADGRWQDAEDALRGMESQTFNAHGQGRWTAQTILTLDGKGNDIEATRMLDRAIGNDAEDPAFVFALAAQLAELGADQRAERVLKRLCDLTPRDPFAHANYAVFLGRMGRFDEAVEAYSQALERNPSFAPAYLQRAYCYHTLGERDASAADYRAYLELEPGDAAAWDALGAVEAERERGDDALAAHRQAIALNPEQPLWLVNAATTARRLGRIDVLTEYAEAIDRLAPTEWHSALVRAYRQHESGDFGAAWSSYREAFHRAEAIVDSEGMSVTGHAVLWYALTSKHSEVFDDYMKRILGHGIFSEGVLAAVRAWYSAESSAARSHDVTIEAARSIERPLGDSAEGTPVIRDGQPAAAPVIGSGDDSANAFRYRRHYEVVAENEDEAAALAVVFEGWCGGGDAQAVSVRAVSEAAAGLRGVYAASMPQPLIAG